VPWARLGNHPPRAIGRFRGGGWLQGRTPAGRREQATRWTDLSHDATRLFQVGLGSGLAELGGFPFAVRHSDGALGPARACAQVAGDAYCYFSRLFSGVEPDIAIIVVGEADWKSRQPFGLPFFNDDQGQIRPGILVMPAASGTFWVAIAKDLRQASPVGFQRLLKAYPDGAGGLNLQPFFDLVTLHELGHAFAVLGDLRLPTYWLGEIFANLALHTFVATQRPEQLETLEALSTVGAKSRRLGRRMRSEGYSTLEELETHYTGGEHPMDPLNYVWYQYRWQRLAARVFEADGEEGLVRLWDCFHARDRFNTGPVERAPLASLLAKEVSETLGRAIRDWR